MGASLFGAAIFAAANFAGGPGQGGITITVVTGPGSIGRIEKPHISRIRQTGG